MYFNNLLETVTEYYELGCEKWKEFLCEIRNFDNNLTEKIIKSEGGVKSPKLVLKKLQIEEENFEDAFVHPEFLGEELCYQCEEDCQKFIQDKLKQSHDEMEEMMIWVTEIIRELKPLIPVVLNLGESIKKIEDILLDQEKLEAIVEECM